MTINGDNNGALGVWAGLESHPHHRYENTDEMGGLEQALEVIYRESGVLPRIAEQDQADPQAMPALPGGEPDIENEHEEQTRKRNATQEERDYEEQLKIEKNQVQEI
jgi:hypothetical protein